MRDMTKTSAAMKAQFSEMNQEAVAATRSFSWLSKSLSKSMKSAFNDMVFEGGKLSDFLNSFARSMARATLTRATDPIFDAIGGAISRKISSGFGMNMPAAGSGGNIAPNVKAFAKGGVISQAVQFPMRGGSTGVMGEAGPEAIMPLSRAADGSLGVRSNAARPTQVTVNIQTPNPQSFHKSSSQISAQIARAVRAGQRNA